MDHPSQSPQGQHEDNTTTQQSSIATQAARVSNLVPNAIPQDDLSGLPMQTGPQGSLDLLPIMPQDGNMLDPNELMDLPFMMPPIAMGTMGGAIDANGMFNMPQNNISNDEIALYDRQIRLWGMQAQQKIRNANVLLITMKGLGNEVAKNLVLAGIGSLTIIDHEEVTEADLGEQFFLSEDGDHLGKNRAQAVLPQVQKMNPRVNVIADTDDVRFKGASYFALFDMIVATDLHPEALNVINTATRLNMRPFYAANTHGLYGFIFADLIEHTFVIEREKPNITTVLGAESRTRFTFHVETRKENGKTMERVSKKELYSTWLLASDGASLPEEYTKSKRRLKAVSPALSCLRALWEFQSAHNDRSPGPNPSDLAAFTTSATKKHKELGLPTETLTAPFLRSFLQNIGADIAPVTAILGGQLAQDIINVLGQTQQPIQNFVIFDGNTMEANIYPLHPHGPLGSQLLSTSGIPGMAGLGNGDLRGLMSDPSTMSMGMRPMGMGFNGAGATLGTSEGRPDFTTMSKGAGSRMNPVGTQRSG